MEHFGILDLTNWPDCQRTHERRQPRKAQDTLQASLTNGVQRSEIRKHIEDGWQSANCGELVNGDEVFDRIDAELEEMERSATK